jgi:hypothetical protein
LLGGGDFRNGDCVECKQRRLRSQDKIGAPVSV